MNRKHPEWPTDKHGHVIVNLRQQILHHKDATWWVVNGADAITYQANIIALIALIISLMAMVKSCH